MRVSAVLLLAYIVTTSTHSANALPIPVESTAIGFASSESSTTCRDGDLSRFVGYSGFKIQRHVVLRGMKPPLLHFVSLSHCNRGELEYERLARTGRETDIEWDKPMCFLGNKRITDDRGVVISKPKTDKKTKQPITELFNFRKVTFDDIPKKAHSVDPLNQPRPPQILDKRSQIRDKFLNFLNKVSKTRFIDYFQDSKVTPYEELKPISYTDIDTDDIQDMHCYKLSRRKKYALRDLMIYAPFTWVGGLFECQFSDDDKKKHLESLKSSKQFSKPLDLQCSSQNSTPLYPLIADDITGIQYEYDKGSLSVIRTPYLYTPSSLDPRFGKPTELLGVASAFLKNVINKQSTDKLPYDHWFEEIDVNENYTYTANDLKSLSSVVTNATHILQTFIKANPVAHWDWDDAGVFGNTERERPHYLELKALLSLTKIKEKAKMLDFVKSLQQGWDDLRLSSEIFTYKKAGTEVNA